MNKCIYTSHPSLVAHRKLHQIRIVGRINKRRGTLIENHPDNSPNKEKKPPQVNAIADAQIDRPRQSVPFKNPSNIYINKPTPHYLPHAPHELNLESRSQSEDQNGFSTTTQSRRPRVSLRHGGTQPMRPGTGRSSRRCLPIHESIAFAPRRRSGWRSARE